MAGYTIEVRNNNIEKALRVLKKKLFDIYVVDILYVIN